MADSIASGRDNMTEIKDNGNVCVVVVIHNMGYHIFGVYESEELARQRVKEHADLGYISDDDLVVYESQTVWGVDNEVD